MRWRLAELAGYPRLGLAMRFEERRVAAAVDRTTVSYGDDPDQRGVMCVGAGGATSETRGDATDADLDTAVLFVHGGSWRSGEPESYRFVGDWFALRGLPTLVAGYRHVPGRRWPAQRDDVLAALVALRERTGARRVILAGHSAGAQLAGVAVYDRVSRRARGIADDTIAGLVAVSGPLDFRIICPRHSMCPLIRELMGGDDGWETADPAALLRPGDPWPVLVVHGARDTLVNVASSTRFAASARDAGSPVELVVEPQAGHSTTLWSFLGDGPMAATLGRFVDAYAGGARPGNRGGRAATGRGRGAAPPTGATNGGDT